MNKFMHYYLATAVLACGCASRGPDIAGTSEQGNAKFTASLYTQTGLPAAGCKAVLLRCDYVADPGAALEKVKIESARTTTDGNGFLSIDSLDTGSYSIEVTDEKANAALLNFTIDTARKPLNWGTDTIRQFAIVQGRIDSVSSQAASRFAQVYGLERLVPVASTGTFVLSDLPQGIYTIRIISADSAAGLTIFDSVAAKAGAVTTISLYRAWKNRASIFFNTTAAGAGIQENVLGFPMLIRLLSDNFSFAEAMPHGEDLRFAKPDGTPLNFEIERWDPDIERAEVWVKIDTIFGNDSNQSIIMFWGNSTEPSRSESERVFDTASGFQGVWHLGDLSDTIHDATGNRCHGIRHGDLARSSGMVGCGQTFGSAAAYCDMGNVLNPGTGSFFASAWVKRDTIGLQTIFAKSTGGSPRIDYGWSLSFGLADQVHCFIASGGSNWGAAGAFDFWSRTDAVVIDTTTWHYIVAVVDRSDGGNCRTYIDGIDVTDTGNGNMAAVGSLVNSLQLRIGAEADGDYQWTGSMDECVISRTVHSEAWIRLCYINQGQNDRMVKFKR
jgi:hypothetical protein